MVSSTCNKVAVHSPRTTTMASCKKTATFAVDMARGQRGDLTGKDQLLPGVRRHGGHPGGPSGHYLMANDSAHDTL